MNKIQIFLLFFSSFNLFSMDLKNLKKLESEVKKAKKKFYMSPEQQESEGTKKIISKARNEEHLKQLEHDLLGEYATKARNGRPMTRDRERLFEAMFFIDQERQKLKPDLIPEEPDNDNDS